MEWLGYVLEAIGTAINGALQVLVDVLNLIIQVVPNPDPFPELIANMPTEVAVDWGFTLYWIDTFIGVEEASIAIGTYISFLLFTAIFAFIYWFAKGVMKL